MGALFVLLIMLVALSRNAINWNNPQFLTSTLGVSVNLGFLGMVVFRMAGQGLNICLLFTMKGRSTLRPRYFMVAVEPISRLEHTISSSKK